MVLMNSSTLVFFVNGKKIVEPEPDPECTLLRYLREKLRLCGTKLGCAEGGCGACTVVVSKYDRKNDRIVHLAVNACLAPVCSMHGLAVTTVEGIGSTRTRLHPVQERIAKAHGSQCGFCTPGIVMSMYALLRSSPVPSMAEMEVAFQGNLCRCTGYRPIIEGYKTFTKEFGGCAMGENCCKNVKSNSLKNGTNGTNGLNGVNGSNGINGTNGFNGTNGLNGENGCPNADDVLFEPNEFTPVDPSQEPIFPPELKLSDELDTKSVVFANSEVTWYRPTTLQEILKIKDMHNDAKIIVGNTEVGVEVKFKHLQYPVLVLPNQIPEMTAIEDLGDALLIGASVTLCEMEECLRKEIDTKPEYETRLFKAMVDMLQYFAGKQIRNVAAIGGNIMTGSPISDMNPILTAAGIAMEVESLKRGRRTVHMGEGFFTGYRKNIVAPDEVLINIRIQRTTKDQHFLAYKQAKRREDDIAIVNGAFFITFEPNSIVVKKASLAYGGMAPVTAMAKKAQEFLVGKKWDSEILEPLYAKLIEDLPLADSAPGGTILYRRSLTLSLFFKAFLDISQRLNLEVPDVEKSGASVFKGHVPKSAQFYELPPPGQSKRDPVGRPKVHVSAFKQATGEAVYCDDIPRFDKELYLGLVLSTKANAKIKSVNPEEALAMPGVYGFFSAKDITHHQNEVGPIFHDEELFRTKTVTCQGQIIACIAAEDQGLAQRAARKVKIEYEDEKPAIVTIEDAIKHNSFFDGYPKKIIKGDVDKAFAEAYGTVEGECRMGGQEHFYLETHAAIAVPKGEDEEIEVFCSSQHPSEIQHLISHVLDIPSNRVTVRVKRMGGGFGGKESRAMMVALPCALAASRLQRPVRLMLDRDEDMAISGTRHPFLCRYKAAYAKDGRITGCDIKIYNNAGYSMDLSCSVLERAMFHYENAYNIPAARVQGWVCRTNLPSNTAFRGFGGPQGMFAGEHIIRQVADALGMDHALVMRRNLYTEGQSTHYNQKLEYCRLQSCWDECLRNANFDARRSRIAAFNEKNRWRKRGMSVVPTKFGIAFTALFLNQAGALVHVYKDGSVLLSHGGTEMGQGLHTKMIQVAARMLGVPPDYIHVSETSTDKVPNTSATAASAGSDLNGMAVMNACAKIVERLAPYRKSMPDKDWKAWIAQAYMDRVGLSATGFYATPDIGYDFATNSGNAFNYFTYGVACSEVEVDCLTGDHQVLRTDIVMDLGSSLNPAIDIGQVEGGFMQGYGLFTIEEMIYSPQGAVMSRGPGVYKLPGFGDIPAEFNVSLLKGAPNPRAVYSSKAVGEPPLFLASSIFFAIKEAIAAARKDAGMSKEFRLESPATAARIRMACQDNITSKFVAAPVGSFMPWNVVP